MNTKVSFVFSLALSGLILACSGTDVSSADGAGGDTSAKPGDGDTLTRDEARELGKSDWPIDYCEEFGWYGDGEYCDDFCPLPDPDCASSCSDLGGTCMTDPGDPGFPALCEDLGMTTIEGSCEAINEACCAPGEDPPPPPPETCEAQGGTCMTDPGDPGFPALCEDLGMTTIEGSCEAINEACCAPGEDPADCESLGGLCMSDPMDPGFPPSCEALDMENVPGGTCEAINQTCCQGPVWF